MRSSASEIVARARFLSIIFVIAALLLSAQLYIVQIIHGEAYRERARGQYVERSRDSLERSDIYFTELSGSLIAAAVMQSGWSLVIVPRDIEEPDVLYEKLSAITSLDRERFFASAAKKNDPHEEVAIRLDDDTASAIRHMRLPGVLLAPDKWRYYPGHELAAHAIGFVGYRGDDRVGVYGLERFYEKTLARIGSGLYVNPFAELFMNIGAALSRDPASNEGDVITSIEPQVETRLEHTLDTVVSTYAPKFAGGIVMDPKTGEIIAMAVRPTFDPNTYGTADTTDLFLNPLVENVYEMGSIMKPLTVAAGLDVGAISQRTTYEDRGCITRSGKTICNYDKKARGIATMQQILNQSLNLGATFIAERVGHNVFREYVHAFGLGEKTGIDLPSEARGRVDTLDGNYEVDLASASFGQSIAMSAIGMTRALGALANDGVLPSPHMAKSVRQESGVVRALSVAEGARVLKSETVSEVSNMLVEVFDTSLLGGILKEEHHTIAAKTGTAQIAIPGGGGYYPDRYLHSFFGYFPAHEPRFIVFLLAVEPKGVEFASASLAKPFHEIAKFLINYYDIPPDR